MYLDSLHHLVWLYRCIRLQYSYPTWKLRLHITRPHPEFPKCSHLQRDGNQYLRPTKPWHQTPVDTVEVNKLTAKKKVGYPPIPAKWENKKTDWYRESWWWDMMKWPYIVSECFKTFNLDVPNEFHVKSLHHQRLPRALDMEIQNMIHPKTQTMNFCKILLW